MEPWLIAVFVVVGLIIFILLIVILSFAKIWVRALASNARIGFGNLIGMKLRRIPPALIVDNRIKLRKAGYDVPARELENFFLTRGDVPSVCDAMVMAYKAGLDITIQDLMAFYLAGGDVNTVVMAMITAAKGGLNISFGDLQAHFLAGGDPQKVVDALIVANRAKIELGFDSAAAIDLGVKGTQRQVDLAVRQFVTPVVIDCPDPRAGKPAIAAVALDGIQMRAKARVTVRTRIEKVIGGATAETIVARVQEGIVTTIGSAKRYKDVLENPDSISKTVLAKGLDAGTAYEILSIDIADVDVVGVGEEGNVDAKLETQRASADLEIARAKAEERRAMAAAREREMIALVQENRAKVVLAEAEIPKAIADSFRSGRLGIMDYYRMRNVQADTSMRENIARGEQAGPSEQIEGR
jgi:uncharacterized protein YqfA (UPF0365 family)